MRIICLLAAFAITQTAQGQDYCSRLKKEISSDKQTYEYVSPYDMNEKPPLKVSRNFNIDPEYAYDNFYMMFRTEVDLDSIYHTKADGTQTEKEERRLIVEFEDQSRIVDDTIRINHDVSDDHIRAVRYLDFPISEIAVKSFASKKITRFSLSGAYQSVSADSADAIMHYVQCMEKAKK